jgi:hypothetical protein
MLGLDRGRDADQLGIEDKCPSQPSNDQGINDQLRSLTGGDSVLEHQLPESKRRTPVPNRSLTWVEEPRGQGGGDVASTGVALEIGEHGSQRGVESQGGRGLKQVELGLGQAEDQTKFLERRAGPAVQRLFDPFELLIQRLDQLAFAKPALLVPRIITTLERELEPPFERIRIFGAVFSME